MRRTAAWMTALMTTWVAMGCGNAKLDVGSNDAAPSSTQTETMVYEGTIDRFMFASGSNRVAMTLQIRGGVVTGTIRMGEAVDIAPMTDPRIGYPMSEEQAPLDFWRNLGANAAVVEGFSYTIVNGTLTGGELLMTAQQGEVWKTWCPLQTPDCTSGTCRCDSCVPSDAAAPGTCSILDPQCAAAKSGSCGTLNICQSNFCQCTQTGCVGVDEREGEAPVAFNMTFSNEQLAGGVTGLWAEALGVALLRR